MSLATQLRAVAKDLIESFGEVAVFSRETGGTFNPATGTKTGTSTESWSIKVTPITYSEGVFDGENVQTGDLKLMFNADVYSPLSGDRVLFDGQSWFVVSVPTYERVEGQGIVYEVQVRR